MSEPIVSIDTSQIREGKLDDLKEAVVELVAFVESNESRPIIYAIYFDEAGTRMTVAQVHPDSQSMEHHMTVAGPAFAGFSELVTLSTLDPRRAERGTVGATAAEGPVVGAGDRGGHDLQAGSPASTRADVGSRFDASRLPRRPDLRHPAGSQARVRRHHDGCDLPVELARHDRAEREDGVGLAEHDRGGSGSGPDRLGEDARG
jgi:hypothetical protein